MKLFLEILRVIVSLGIFIAILFAVKYATAYWVKRNQLSMKDKNIKIIEQVPLAKDTNVFLINYKNNEYIIGTTLQNIMLIDKIKLEEMDNHGN